jgi:hypothetical protein
MVDALAIAIIVAFFAFCALVVRWLSRVVDDADTDAVATGTVATGTAAAEPEREPVPAGRGAAAGRRM